MSRILPEDIVDGLFECESYREARRQMWRWRMILVGSIVVWLTVLAVVNLQLSGYKVVSGLVTVGGVVVIACAAVFYRVNNEVERLEDESNEFGKV